MTFNSDMDRTNHRLEREKAHGEFIAEKGEQVWNWSSPAGQVRWARRCRMFREFVGNKEKRILEIGCGTGLFTEELAETNNTLVAMDISEALVEKARERVDGENVQFVVGNAYGTDFADDSFDFIIGSSVLHHLDVHAALTEFNRLLRLGGGIMFTEPNMLNPQIALQKNILFLKKLAGDSPDETAFFRWPLKRIMMKHGFGEVQVEPFDFLHPAIPKSLLSIMNPCCKILEKTPFLREIAGSLLIRGQKL